MKQRFEPCLVEWVQNGDALELRTSAVPNAMGVPTCMVYTLGRVWLSRGTWFAQLANGTVEHNIADQDVAQRCLISMERDREPLVGLFFDRDNWESVCRDHAEMRSFCL